VLKVSRAITPKLTLLSTDDTLYAVREKLGSGLPGWTHQGYPVVDPAGNLAGVLTLRDLHNPVKIASQRVGDLLIRPPLSIYPDATLRDAANMMIRHDVGRLVVVDPSAPLKPIGIITRSDLLRAQRHVINETVIAHPSFPRRRATASANRPDTAHPSPPVDNSPPPSATPHG
jgi:CBS domain-containing protein